MDKFEKACRASERLGEANDCTVKAISIAGRVPYNVAYDACKAEGRRYRCGMYPTQWKRAILRVGCAYIEVAKNPLQRNGSRYTVKTIGQKYPQGYYIVKVRGHALAMVNGQVLDWTEGRKHRVQEVIKVIVPKGSRS